MKNSVPLLIVTVLVTVSILACQSDINKDQNEIGKSEANAAMAAFVADPQDIPKQEVATLSIGAKAPDFNLPNVDGKFYTLPGFCRFRASSDCLYLQSLPDSTGL